MAMRTAAMRTAALISAIVSVIGIGLLPVGGSAQAQIYHANDTGGIIPWSCDTEAAAYEIAGAYCARFDKYPRITSVHRHFGEYISFNCLWSPYMARYALPAVPVRTACLWEKAPHWRRPY
jgi:hypothetical protein